MSTYKPFVLRPLFVTLVALWFSNGVLGVKNPLLRVCFLSWIAETLALDALFDNAFEVLLRREYRWSIAHTGTYTLCVIAGFPTLFYVAFMRKSA